MTELKRASRRAALVALFLSGLASTSCRQPVGPADTTPALPETAVKVAANTRSAVATNYTVDAMTIETRYWNSAPWVVVTDGITTWTRTPPTGAGALTLFQSLPRNVSGYTNTPVELTTLRCATIVPGFVGTPPDYADGFLTEYSGCIRNPAGAHLDIGMRYRARITAKRNTNFAVRFAVDFAGGVLIVDGVVVKQLWSDPFWNGYFDIDNGTLGPDGVTYTPKIETDTSTVLTASFTMRANTTHIVEVVGFENGADFGASAQFNDGGGWVDAVEMTPPYRVALTTSVGAGGGSVVSSPAGIACGTACSASFAWATMPSLTPTADQYFAFGGWSGACTGTATCTPLLETPQSVTATFTRVQWPLRVSFAGAGTGMVASSNGAVNCTAACEAGFNVGSTATLTATPAPNSVFTGWSGACTGTTTCTVSMDQARAVTATFTTRVSGDTDPPVISCKATPDVLWPQDHKLQDISVRVTLSDAGSGAANFTLLSVTSNQPANAAGDGNTSADIVGWTIGTPDVKGQLRAERQGTEADRVYTLTYRGFDVAGNSTTTSCTVTVPHDQGDKDGPDGKNDRKP